MQRSMAPNEWRRREGRRGLVGVLGGLVVGTMVSVAWAQPAGSEPAPDPLPEGDTATYPELPTPAEVAASPSAPPASTGSATPPAPVRAVPSAPPAPEPETDTPPETLFGGDQDVVLGGFGGLNVRYTRVLGADSVWVGGEGALLLNHAFSVGAGGGGIGNEINPTGKTRLDFGYGGLIVRYHFFSSEVVNFAVGGLVGGGAIAVHDRHDNPDDIDWEKIGETVFVFEPELGLYLNMTRWMRVGITGGYRFVSGVDKNDLSETDVRGAAGGGSVQFGWF